MEALQRLAFGALSEESKLELVAKAREKRPQEPETPPDWSLLDRFDEILSRRYPSQWSESAELARERLQEHFARSGYVSAVTVSERERRIALVLEFERAIAP